MLCDSRESDRYLCVRTFAHAIELRANCDMEYRTEENMIHDFCSQSQTTRQSLTLIPDNSPEQDGSDINSPSLDNVLKVRAQIDDPECVIRYMLRSTLLIIVH